MHDQDGRDGNGTRKRSVNETKAYDCHQTKNASTFTKCTVILLNSDPKRKEKYVWDCDEEMCGSCK